MNTTTDLPYKNPNLPPERAHRRLLGRMTLEEKVGPDDATRARSGDLDDLIVGSTSARSCILPAGPARGRDREHERPASAFPLIIGDDCITAIPSGEGSTIFPSQLGMAASFDTARFRPAGRATAEEVSTTGVHWTFSPVLCIARDTRWGRVDETFGEDPYLIGEMASSIVKGYQGGAKAGEPLAKDAIPGLHGNISPAIRNARAAATRQADLSIASWNRGFLRRSERAWEACGVHARLRIHRRRAMPSTSGCCPTAARRLALPGAR